MPEPKHTTTKLPLFRLDVRLAVGVELVGVQFPQLAPSFGLGLYLLYFFLAKLAHEPGDKKSKGRHR